MGMKATLRAGLAAILLLAGCRDRESGPVAVSVVGQPPRLVNPNLEPLGAPDAYLLEATAQGLVRYDASGQIEPALAQSWIVSDDGLRYTFRIVRGEWTNGGPITAEQVASRLRAVISRASRNPLKPLLLVVDDVEAMTETVLEISLKAPRPHFLQLLAQPEMAVIRSNAGTGPFRASADESGIVLSMHRPDEEEDVEGAHAPDVVLRGEAAALAVARFGQRGAALVTGGTFNELPIARVADLPADALRFDPVNGMFGLVFVENEGIVADAAVRQALSMAVDREALNVAIAVPDLQPRLSIVPPGIDELPAPAAPEWADTPLVSRRTTAGRIVAQASKGEPVMLRVALPDGPGYRLLFAHLRRDWRAIGVEARAVGYSADADLRLYDAVAPANISTWYLRRFSCEASVVCSEEADRQLEVARLAPTAAERRELLAGADRLLNELVPFIPLTAPVRWSLVAPRANGFQANPFGRHFVGALVVDEP
jgi:oligopeptide transport system substrate-binding protein